MNTFLGMDEALSSLIDAVPVDAPIRATATRLGGRWIFVASATVGDAEVSQEGDTPSAAVAALKDALINEQLAHGVRP